MNLRRLLPVCVLLLGTGCVNPIGNPHARVNDMQRTELYFGRSTNVGGHVTDEQWSAFVDREITARFPAGITILNADGQWTDPKGALVHEDSRVIILLHGPERDAEHKIEAIRDAYVKQFSQDAVMRVDSPAKVRF